MKAEIVFERIKEGKRKGIPFETIYQQLLIEDEIEKAVKKR